MTIKMRRDSAEDSSSATFNTSPETGWNGFNFNTPVTSSMNASTTAFMQHRNQGPHPPCLDLNTNQGYSHQQWPMSAGSDTFSPTAGIDHIPDFNNPFAMNQVGGFATTLVSPGPLQHSAFPTSPPFSTSSSDGGRQNSTAGHPQSPPSFATVANIIRRDGIRKKNARFDIPAERNLKTIDQLINSTNDESELKELKQQKRLLRNRQAALDSRQRKKQHTERLEEEKKAYSAHIGDLEDELAHYKAKDAEWIRKEEAWAMTQQQYHTHFDTLRMQQEELVRQHTIETGDLRRKNTMLMEQLHSTSMSNAPSSHGAEFSEFDQMNMGHWDNMSMAHEFTIENDHTVPQEQVVKPVEAEKPAASALLLMLLLCGAWVASRNNGSGSNVLPAIPDDMRAASATVLDNLYRDSGVQLDGVKSTSRTGSVPTSKTVLSIVESAGAFTPSLDALHQRLVSPTNQQLKDQAFSLTPSQYYDMTSGDTRYQQAYYDHQRRANMPGAAQQEIPTMAETYTRSLLRNKVSTQILKDFARMVAQGHQQPDTSIHWKSEPM